MPDKDVYLWKSAFSLSTVDDTEPLVRTTEVNLGPKVYCIHAAGPFQVWYAPAHRRRLHAGAKPTTLRATFFLVQAGVARSALRGSGPLEAGCLREQEVAPGELNGTRQAFIQDASARNHNRSDFLHPYEQALAAEGLPASRIGPLWDALNLLHSAICRMDLETRQIFWKTALPDRLDAFAQAEDLAAVTLPKESPQ